MRVAVNKIKRNSQKGRRGREGERREGRVYRGCKQIIEPTLL
jgi:hypothetical protein